MRLGRGGVPFAMWKFRSMRALAGSNAGSDEDRVTRFGRLLRRYHIDELAATDQRDHGRDEPRRSSPGAAGDRRADPRGGPRLRSALSGPSGMAGLAQSLVEYDSRPSVKLRYDLTYMCSWSLWLDIRLMFRSVAAALSGSGV